MASEDSLSIDWGGGGGVVHVSSTPQSEELIRSTVAKGPLDPDPALVSIPALEAGRREDPLPAILWLKDCHTEGGVSVGDQDQEWNSNPSTRSPMCQAQLGHGFQAFTLLEGHALQHLPVHQVCPSGHRDDEGQNWSLDQPLPSGATRETVQYYCRHGGRSSKQRKTAEHEEIAEHAWAANVPRWTLVCFRAHPFLRRPQGGPKREPGFPTARGPAARTFRGCGIPAFGHQDARRP